jgi:choline-glycine betaine transporter
MRATHLFVAHIPIWPLFVGPAIFVYCVQEPLSHQMGSAYAQAGYHSQHEIHMFAINMTVTNWGVTCWVQYTLVAICLSLAGYRFNLPMTFRSCFYPILGPYTWGWMGDFIDALSIVVTLAGVCATLAEPALQIVEGLLYIGWVDASSQTSNITSIQISTIWLLTMFSTVSVIWGLRGGIQFICWSAMIVAVVLLLLVFVLDDSTYLLNLIVQEIGYYLQNSIFELNLWTDAFAQLREGSGRAVDGKSADQTWANDWIVFYQAWAVTWSAVVGVFVAYLSRGRRIWELALYYFAAPLGFCLIWLSVWGGIALRQSRQATEMEMLGREHFNSSAHFVSSASPFCYEVPQMDVVVNGEVVFTNHLPGVTPVCRFDEAHHASAVFNVLYSFSFPESFDNGLGECLSLLFLLCCAVFYLATADAGSLMVDRICVQRAENKSLGPPHVLGLNDLCPHHCPRFIQRSRCLVCHSGNGNHQRPSNGHSILLYAAIHSTVLQSRRCNRR